MQFFLNEETKAPNQMYSALRGWGVGGGGWEAPRNKFPKLFGDRDYPMKAVGITGLR